jgi:hypothetical protein
MGMSHYKTGTLVSKTVKKKMFDRLIDGSEEVRSNDCNESVT